MGGRERKRTREIGTDSEQNKTHRAIWEDLDNVSGVGKGSRRERERDREGKRIGLPFMTGSVTTHWPFNVTRAPGISGAGRCSVFCGANSFTVRLASC